MKRRRRGWLFSTPRILMILFAVFISLFAMDVFMEGYSPWETIVALFMHLIPTFLVVIALLLAWRWEWVGTVLCFALAILYIVVMRHDWDWVSIAMIPGPLIVTGVLWLLAWLQKRKVSASA
jgi:hypothetical protein